MTRVQIEAWSDVLPEAKEIFPLHWRELALFQDKYPMGMDEARYLALEAAKILHVVTARAEGRLVGYLFCFVMPHLHYKDAGEMALVDMYYVLPEFRKGTGAKLFIEAERSLKARGVIKIITSCKVKQDHSALFEALGFEWTDKTFCKYIGAKCQ